MATEDDGIGPSGGPHGPAAEAAGTPLRGDLVCGNSFRGQTSPKPAANRSETDPQPVGNRPSLGGSRALASVLEAARSSREAGRGPGGRGCRSPMFDWMLRHHSALALELDGPRRPNWRALSARLAELGATDGAGHPAKPDVARRTWRKVKAAAAGRAAPPPHPSGSGGPRPAPPQGSGTGRPAPAAVPPPSADVPPQPTRRFSMGARPRPWSPPPDACEE